MRAQIFYITGFNALEDAASHYFPIRDDVSTESNQPALRHRLLWVSDKRNRHVWRLWWRKPFGGGAADAARLLTCSSSPSSPLARLAARR
jgi:hypothetical protein